jgi:carbamoyl-phosphate synthase large subunit
MAMNVLVTGAGRRSYLIAALKSAVGPGGQVVACDMSADAPALQHADRGFLVPPVDGPGYLDALLQICESEQIGLLIPSLEPELWLLATHRAQFAALGTVAVVASPKIVATCYDKLRAAKFLIACGVGVPRTWVSLDTVRSALATGELNFPVVVKPRWGVASIGFALPEGFEELTLSCRVARRLIARSMIATISATDSAHCILFQERLIGDEYGLDVVNDLHGRYVCTFVKRKLRMRAGQTDRAVTVDDERMQSIGREIGKVLGHVGVLDCDAVDTATGIVVLDLNPGIGGGYPFSHLAGADIPAALVAWARGREPDPAWLRVTPNVRASRSDSFAIVASGHLATIAT